jgi:hypothetical protein
MAIAWSRDREANRAALASDAQRIHMLQVHASQAVGNSQSASPTATPAATPAASTATAPVTTAQATPAAPVNISITHVVDSLGNVWTGMIFSGVVHVKTGTVVTITATAEDPLGRKLEYEFWRGDAPTQTLVCGWGSPSCQWTAAVTNPPCEANCGTVHIWMAVRDQDPTHRYPACFKLDPCDDLRFVSYDPEPF